MSDIVKQRIFFWTALFYITYMIFPLLSDTFNIPVWLPSSITVLIILFLYFPYFSLSKNPLFLWTCIYSLLLFIYAMVGKDVTVGIGTIGASKALTIEMAWLLPPVCICSVLYFEEDDVLQDKLMKWSVFLLYASFVFTVPLMQKYGSIREALQEQNAANEGSGTTTKLMVPGLPSYALMHAYTLFLPALCFAVKRLGRTSILDRRKWLIAMAALLILVYVIFGTYVTTSYTIMLFILLFTIFYTGSSLDTFIFFFVMVVLFALYYSGVFVTILQTILPFFEGTVVEPKILGFINDLTVGNENASYLGVRENLHAVSWHGFINNPLFGGGQDTVGGHSTAVDRLGGMGILVFVPYFMIYFMFTKHMLRKFLTKQGRVFFLVLLAASATYLYEKGLWGAENWLFMMIITPYTILWIEKIALKQSGGIE